MVKFLLLVVILVCKSAFADVELWPSLFSRTYVLNTERRIEGSILSYSSVWRETANEQSQLLGIPVSKISPGYMLMMMGHLVLGVSSFSSSYQFEDPSVEMEALLKLSQERQIATSELTGPSWIHLLKPIDKEEEACLWEARKNGQLVGCGDMWQGGLTDDKVVCVGERTFLKCQIDCIKTIYNREKEIDARPGFCPEVRK